MTHSCATIVVPALNEEGRLAETVREVVDVAERCLAGYEVIVVNDGSTDGTGAVADALRDEFGDKLTVVHFPVNRGVGAAYAEGLRRARHPYLTLVPGDRAFRVSGLERVFGAIGTAPVVISYRVNPRARTPLRRVLSRLGTFTLRLLVGKRIRDAHGLYAFPVDIVRAIPVSNGYTYHIEALTQLLWRCPDFAEVPVELTPKPDSSSGVMKWSTFLNLLVAVLRLSGLRIAHWWGRRGVRSARAAD